MNYWAYLHVNGTLQMRLLVGENYNYACEDALGVNSLIQIVLDPVEATNGETARKMLARQLTEKGYKLIGKTKWGEDFYGKV
jgi:hypothetical protein